MGKKTTCQFLMCPRLDEAAKARADLVAQWREVCRPCAETVGHRSNGWLMCCDPVSGHILGLIVRCCMSQRTTNRPLR